MGSSIGVRNQAATRDMSVPGDGGKWLATAEPRHQHCASHNNEEASDMFSHEGSKRVRQINQGTETPRPHIRP